MKKTLKVSLLVCAVVAGSVTLSASRGYSDSDLNFTPTKKISTEEARKASDCAVGVMKHVAQARGDIFNKEYSLALDDLKMAQNKIEDIRAAQPTYLAKNRIWIAQKHLEYESLGEVEADLVPIYSELDLAQAYVPTKLAKSHLDKAKECLKNGDKVGAKGELALAADSASLTQIDMPLQATEDSISKAQMEINQKKYSDADKTLKGTENSLIVTMDVVTAMPQTRISKADHIKRHSIK